MKTNFALVALLSAVCVFLCINADVAESAQSVAEKRSLTTSERRGKEIYLRGVSSSGREITANMGELSVPASTLACAGCHGMRGEGKTEGGVTAGNLTWSNLIKPYGHNHPSGRRHGPFNESSVTRAVVNGVDTDNNDLLAAMPRYRLSAEDMADLLAYLKRIETDLDPGLTDNSITIGLMLPSQGALADVGAAMKDVFAAYFNHLNNQGGIFNRKIELRVADADAGGANTAAIAQSFAQREQIFAFVGGVSAGADAQLARLARDEEIPFIGPATLLPNTENPVNRYVFYLLPGVAEQAISLVNFAVAQPDSARAPIALVYSQNSLSVAAATAAEEQVKKLKRAVVAKEVYGTNNFEARRVVSDLKSKGVATVFFFGAGHEQAVLLSEAAAAAWTPQFFFLGAMSGKELSTQLSPELTNKIFIAFPTVPADISNEGMAEFGALHEKYKFAPRHTASQLAAFAAAKVFVEALTRAGKDLNREKLVIALEGLYDYDTGVTPHLTFGPNRRIGAAGAHIVTIDPATKELVTLGPWVKAY